MKKIINLVKEGTTYQVGAVTEAEITQIKTDISTVSGIATSHTETIGGLRTDVDTISGKVETLEQHNIFKVVATLPSSGEPNVVYLVLDSEGVEGNIYIEYIYVNNKWEELGRYKTNVDLTGYAKEDWVNTQISNDDKTVFLTQSEFDALTDKNPKIVYYIYTE